MAKKSAPKTSRKRVKRLPKLKGGQLFEISPKNRPTKAKKRPIPKGELKSDEP